MAEADITRLLIAHRDGDGSAFEQLVPLIYQDLQRIAHRQLARRRPGETLNTNALVHEAYLKLVNQSHIEINDRNHFFAIAAQAMRQIIIDYARERSTQKRGSGTPTVALDQVTTSVADQAEMLITIDAALSKLSEFNQRQAQVFECRYFAGFTEQETSAALSLPLRTVQRDWMKSKAWLRNELVPS